MNRRGFIQAFIGAAAMAVVPKNDDGVMLRSMKHPTLLHDAAHHDLTGGFSLVQAKPEGASIPYDPGLRAEFPKALKEGLNKAFGDVYEELEPDNMEELWIDIDD